MAAKKLSGRQMLKRLEEAEILVGQLKAQLDNVVADNKQLVTIASAFEAEAQNAKSNLEKCARAVESLYYAAKWSADRPVDEEKLWTDVRDAFGFEPGKSPVAEEPKP